MNDSSYKLEWVELSSPWIKEAREGRNPTRNGLLDKPMIEECGDVRNLKILDCGCGEGRFCRIMSEAGAQFVLGVDMCEPMIEAAKEIINPKIEFKVADVQNLGFLKDETFDIAVSYLNQCDISDYEKNNKDVYRILKWGGRFIVANLHPMRSAVGRWHVNSEKEKAHVILDNYFDESERRWKMMGIEFTNFHRTLSSYVNSFIRSGFFVAKIIEPSVDENQLEAWHELSDELRVPNFIIYSLVK